MNYAYYPGCSLHASAKEYDTSWRAVCERLGIELSEMADWSCCGTVHATSVDRTTSLALAARNLSIAEAMNLEIIAPCSGCYKNQGTSAVKHPLYVILEKVGLEKLAEDCPRPLHGLAVAPYYGCVLTRPPATEPVDDPEDPQGLDRLLQALGAEVVPYAFKTKCCGGAVLLSHTDISLDLTGKLLQEAKESGAQCLAVACPMCQMALDAYQSKVEKRLGERLDDLPILYFTQLMGLALGISEWHLDLGRLVVSPAKVLAQV